MRLLEKLLNTRNGGVEHIGDVFRAFVFVRTAFGDFKDAGFRQVEQIFAGAPLGIETGLGDLIRHRDHLADNGTFTDDISVSADIRGTWRVFRQFCQIGKPADTVELSQTLQRFCECNQVDRAARLLQTRHFSKDVAVRAGIEVFRNNALGDVVPAFVIQH